MANSIFEESPARFNPVSLVRQAEFKLSLTPSAKRVVFRADIPFDRMPRLAALLIQESNSGEISSASISDESGVSVEFSLETYARAGIEELSDDIARDAPTIEARGKLSAGLLLQCQRCLHPCLYQMEETFRLVFATSEKVADAMPDDLEPVMLDDEGCISLAEMLEDEVLLHLPAVARHQTEEECSFENIPFPQHKVDVDVMNEPPRRKENPFAVLKDIKFDQH